MKQKQSTIVPLETKQRRVRSSLKSFTVAVDRTDDAGTSFAGLPLAIETFHALGLPEAIRSHVAVKQRARGPSEAEWIEALTMLLISGGDSLEDLTALKQDLGLARVWSVPQQMSPRSALDFLYRFHDPTQPGSVQGTATIRPETAGLRGLAKVNQHLLAEVQRRRPVPSATLDVDASLHPSTKREALFCYEKYRAYQPVIAWWAEQKLVVADQFRDGNVPAGMGNREFLERSFAAMPAEITKRMLRADSALYEFETLRWADRQGIAFAVTADMTQELREKVKEVPEAAWQQLRNREGHVIEAGREWAEVEYVSGQDCGRKGERPFRYVAVRVPQQPDLFGEADPFRYFAVVTNRDLPGEQLINWHREKCGTVEHAHDRLKNEVATATFPSGQFGANAAWYRLAILASNVARAMQMFALTGPEWADTKLTTLRYRFLRLGGRLVKHARTLVMVLSTASVAMAQMYAAARAALAAAISP